MYRAALFLDSQLSSRGGLNVLVEAIADGLTEHGEITVFSRTEIQPGINSSPRQTFKNITIGDSLANPKNWPAIIERMDRDGIQIALLHGGEFAWGPHALKLSFINVLKSRGIFCVFTNHQATPFYYHLPTLDSPKRRTSFRRILRFAASWAFKMIQLSATDREILVSQHDYEQSRRRYSPFADRLRVVYHSRLSGIPPIRFQEKEKIILNVGHLAYRKGQHVLLDAFLDLADKFPEWSLCFAGAPSEPNYLEKMQELVRQQNLQRRVSFLMEQLDVTSLFSAASIYVQPSLIEAYGLALQEAMYFGCACIGARAGGIPESIRHERMGRLFEAGSVSELSRALAELMDDSKLRDRVADSARLEFIESDRSKNAMINSYHEMILEILKARALT